MIIACVGLRSLGIGMGNRIPKVGENEIFPALVIKLKKMFQILEIIEFNHLFHL